MSSAWTFLCTSEKGSYICRESLNLELVILVLQPLECWDYKQALSHLTLKYALKHLKITYNT